jgi:hypothetical protein
VLRDDGTHLSSFVRWRLASGRLEADPASVGYEPDSRAGLLTPVRELKLQLAAFLEPFADGDDA